MDLQALNIFLAVAHERSFSRAAAKVHRTQPAVSQAVRRLEADLGEELIDRSSKSGTLTEAGKVLQNYGQRLIRLVPPSHPFATHRQVTMEDVGTQAVVAHNDPSPARERVLRLFEQRHIALNMVIALPSLDGIKRAVELGMGVALLPRRCAVTELASGRLVALPVAGLSRRRQLTIVCRRAHRSHAANAFLGVADEKLQTKN